MRRRAGAEGRARAAQINRQQPNELIVILFVGVNISTSSRFSGIAFNAFGLIDNGTRLLPLYDCILFLCAHFVANVPAVPVIVEIITYIFWARRMQTTRKQPSGALVARMLMRRYTKCIYCYRWRTSFFKSCYRNRTLFIIQANNLLELNYVLMLYRAYLRADSFAGAFFGKKKRNSGGLAGKSGKRKMHYNMNTFRFHIANAYQQI